MCNNIPSGGWASPILPPTSKYRKMSPDSQGQMWTTYSNKGWECPKCGHCYSPAQVECTHCNKDKENKNV